MKFPLPVHHRLARALACGLFGVAIFVCAGCQTKPTLPKYVAEFYLEAPNQSGIAFTLPISQLTYHRTTDSILDMSQVTGIQSGHVTVNLPDGSTQQKSCVFFFFNDDGRERLESATGSNQQRRIFLFLNQKPIGVRYIDQPIETGQLFMFLEVPEKDLPTYVADLDASLKVVKDLKK